MRLSGLQNPQAARPVAPVSTARPGNIPGWRLTPYPGYEIARPTRSQPPSGRFPGGGAMRLSGLQNPQAARPVAPVSTARPGNIPGWRLTPYPGYEIARPTRSQPPSGRFPGGGAMRLSGLQNPQAARPVAPVSTARPGNIPGWRLTPYPGYEIARATRSQPPSGR